MEAVNRNPQRQTDNMGLALDNSPQQLQQTKRTAQETRMGEEGPGKKPAQQSVL